MNYNRKKEVCGGDFFVFIVDGVCAVFYTLYVTGATRGTQQKVLRRPYAGASYTASSTNTNPSLSSIFHLGIHHNGLYKTDRTFCATLLRPAGHQKTRQVLNTRLSLATSLQLVLYVFSRSHIRYINSYTIVLCKVCSLALWSWRSFKSLTYPCMLKYT